MRFCLTIDAANGGCQTREELSDLLFDLSIRVLSSDTSGEVRNSANVSVGSWEIRQWRWGDILHPRGAPRMFDSEDDLTCYTEIPEKY